MAAAPAASTSAVSPNPTSSTTTSSSISSTSTSLPPTTTSTSISSTTSSSSTSTSTTSSSSTTTTISSTSTTISSTSTSISSTSTTTSIPPTTVIITSTSPATQASQTQTASASSTTSSSPASSTSAAASSGSSGLSAGGTIAVAVVVPVVSVGLIICVLIWWWRRRKANKLAEEERRKEVEEYGFNPNNDPSGPGAAAASVSNTYSERYAPDDGGSGYRGWGTTSHPRKPSTNLSSGAGMSIPMSDTGSAAGYGRHTASPNDAPMHYGDGGVRPDSAEVAAGANDSDIRRGTSNASSAYSAGMHSEGSEDAHMVSAGAGHYYDENNAYYHSSQPYGDPGYGSAAPVIRDVQARRNTRIENAAVYPQQGNAGIAQNF